MKIESCLLGDQGVEEREWPSWKLRTTKSYLPHKISVESIAAYGTVVVYAYHNFSGTYTIHVEFSDGAQDPLKIWPKSDFIIPSFVLLPKKNILVFADNQEIVLWHLGQRAEIARIQAHAHEILNIAYCESKSSLASCDNDGTLRLWRVKHK